MIILDSELEKFATPRQWEILTVWRDEGSSIAAAKKLGISRGNFDAVKKAVLKRAAMNGYAPESDLTHIIPDGFAIKGVSDMRVNSLGKPQWIKYDATKEKLEELLRSAVKAMCDEITPVDITPAPDKTSDNLLNKYVITDAHVGMLAWHREGGSNWNLDIAEKVIVGAMSYAIKNSPDAHTGYICQLGDFLHFDGLDAVTPTSKHVLDSDGRFGKVVEYAIRILRRVVNMCLDKHSHVHIVMAEGNHDLASSVWLRKLFKTLYSNEPRVTVDDSELPYYALQWGDVMLAAHHSHLKKFGDLDRVMAALFHKIWGDTIHRYVDCGHYHHQEKKENHGMTLEQHRTLAAKDAYASRGGYFAGRDLTSVTYHKNLGEIGRVSVTPEMFMPKGYDK